MPQNSGREKRVRSVHRFLRIRSWPGPGPRRTSRPTSPVRTPHRHPRVLREATAPTDCSFYLQLLSSRRREPAVTLGTGEGTAPSQPSPGPGRARACRSAPGRGRKGEPRGGSVMLACSKRGLLLVGGLMGVDVQAGKENFKKFALSCSGGPQ